MPPILSKTQRKAHFSKENPARNFLDQENGNYIRKGLRGLITFFAKYGTMQYILLKVILMGMCVASFYVVDLKGFLKAKIEPLF